jgi:hypothetical protein
MALTRGNYRAVCCLGQRRARPAPVDDGSRPVSGLGPLPTSLLTVIRPTLHTASAHTCAGPGSPECLPSRPLRPGAVVGVLALAGAERLGCQPADRSQRRRRLLGRRRLRDHTDSPQGLALERALSLQLRQELLVGPPHGPPCWSDPSQPRPRGASPTTWLVSGSRLSRLPTECSCNLRWMLAIPAHCPHCGAAPADGGRQARRAGTAAPALTGWRAVRPGRARAERRLPNL